jgi:hypothetical protein
VVTEKAPLKALSFLKRGHHRFGDPPRVNNCPFASTIGFRLKSKTSGIVPGDFHRGLSAG